MVKKLIQYFIPVQSSAEKDDLRTDRIFIAVLLISALSNLLGINQAIGIGLPSIGLLLLFNAVFAVSLLFLFRKGFSRVVLAHIFFIVIAASLMTEAYYQGGLMTPGTAAFFLVPALAMLIVGKKGAIWWLVVTALMTTAFYVYETTVGPIPMAYNPEKQQQFFFSSILGINLTIFFILLVYENSKNRALKDVQKKHADLLSAQSQLIQAEKMASLGELTAGIAHEIQNPLNFVNNFSELNGELIGELEEEIRNGKIEEAIAIAKDILENQQKINHHGKRAESIVKGMLLHSRGSSGQKELTDLNALADEYLRLSYHGFRAKDKSFNADFKLETDSNLPKVNVVPQDFGRVLLNLINNAFYAVSEKAKLHASSYKPQVIVSTKKQGSKIEISVKDNGNGIPESVKEKIFQPFFTTKPTGQGTGLGLSLSYDIVKAHGGEITLETEDGQGTEFKITLPTKI